MRATIAISIFALSVVACDTGDAGDDGFDTDRIVCMAELSVTGMHIEGDNGPEPCIDPEIPDNPPGCLPEGALGGCRPHGTWRFTASITSNDCTPTPTLLPMYEFTVSPDMTQADPYYYWMYDVVLPSDDPEAELKVTSGGGGLCEADLQLFPTDDGKTTLILHPAIQSDMGNPPRSTGQLLGMGTFEIHTESQIPRPGT
jgi:hypothetical protein